MGCPLCRNVGREVVVEECPFKRWKREPLLRPYETYFVNRELRIVLALCSQAGEKGECNRRTETLCWLHEETKKLGYHLVCGPDKESLEVGRRVLYRKLGLPED